MFPLSNLTKIFTDMGVMERWCIFRVSGSINKWVIWSWWSAKMHSYWSLVRTTLCRLSPNHVWHCINVDKQNCYSFPSSKTSILCWKRDCWWWIIFKGILYWVYNRNYSIYNRHDWFLRNIIKVNNLLNSWNINKMLLMLFEVLDNGRYDIICVALYFN